MIEYLLTRSQGIAVKNTAVKVATVHIDRRYLMIVVGRVVINALIGTHTRGIYRYFVLVTVGNVTASRLIDRVEDVEKLAHALTLSFPRHRVIPLKGRPYNA